MTAKQRLIEYIAALPDEMSEAEIRDSLRVREKIEEGIRSAKEEPVVDNAELPNLLKQWVADA